MNLTIALLAGAGVFALTTLIGLYGLEVWEQGLRVLRRSSKIT